MRSRAIWAVAWALIVVFSVVSLFDLTNVVVVLLYGLTIAAYGLMGALVMTRVPRNRIGPLMLAAATLLFVGLVAGAISFVGATSQPPWPGAWLAAMISELFYIYPIILMLIGIPLIFPDGHLLSPRWRWLVVLTVAGMAAASIDMLLRPGSLGPAEIANPIAVPALRPWLDALNTFGTSASIVGFGGAALSVVLRYRRGRSLEREQVKWLAAVATVAGLSFTVAILSNDAVITPLFWFIGFLALVTVPIAIAIAITRYHLYDIDRIVSRSVSYLVVTALLVTAFGATVLLLQSFVSGAVASPDPTLDPRVVAVSTLVVAALFNPVRTRVQSVVDRRFHRARYDAERTVASFAGRLRDELDLATLAADLRRTTVEAVAPATTAVWIRGTARA